MLPCVIPLKDGHWIHQDVLDGLRFQTVPVRMIPISRPAVGDRYAAQAITRNRVLQVLAEMDKEPFAMMMDRDVVLTYPRTLETAIAKLDDDARLKCVHLRVKEFYTQGHFDIGCMIFKTEIIPRLAFYPDGTGTCNCDCVTKALKAQEWKQDWLNEKRQGHIHAYTELEG